MVRIEVYSPDKLVALLSSYSEASEAVVKSKDHLDYFKNYLGYKGAACVVVEERYVDRDFLEDYASYYVRCFHDYERTCTRLHFFSTNLEQAQLDKAISGEASIYTEEELQSSYLGFIIVKPLPRTIIGRTCLQPYDSDAERRYFVTRKYKVSLFGIPLEIETLAFQEQDSVAGACATSALWSIFQGTAYAFQHHVPSPVEITNYSDDAKPTESRRSPSRGLTREQAVAAIRKVGLEPIRVSTADAHTLVSTAYAYLGASIPLYLGVRLFEAPNTVGPIDHTLLNEIGGHAIAVSGYSIGKLKEVPYEVGDFRLRASRVDKLYGHDDQIGPFARMNINHQPIVFDTTQPPNSHLVLAGTWRHGNPARKIIVVPEELILPLYHKIRVPFELIQAMVLGFDIALKGVVSKVGVLSESLVWDISLTTINQVRQEIRQMTHVDTARRLELCTNSLPRFVWRARLTQSLAPALTILFDATDIEQGKVVSEIILEDKIVSNAAVIASRLPTVKVDQELTKQWPIWQHLSEQP